jgi:hypothetical protein
MGSQHLFGGVCNMDFAKEKLQWILVKNVKTIAISERKSSTPQKQKGERICEPWEASGKAMQDSKGEAGQSCQSPFVFANGHLQGLGLDSPMMTEM